MVSRGETGHLFYIICGFVAHFCLKKSVSGAMTVQCLYQAQLKSDARFAMRDLLNRLDIFYIVEKARATCLQIEWSSGLE